MTSLAHQIAAELNDASDEPIASGEAGATWGSPKRYRQQLILESHGARSVHRGYALEDSSVVVYRDGAWTAIDGVEAEPFISGVLPNDLGLTAFKSAEIGGSQLSLTAQLDHAGVTYQRRELPPLYGHGGNAAVVTYTSPRTGSSVVTLVVPHRPEIDQYVEDLYIFEGLDHGEAQDRNWVELYERLIRLVA